MSQAGCNIRSCANRSKRSDSSRGSSRGGGASPRTVSRMTPRNVNEPRSPLYGDEGAMAAEALGSGNYSQFSPNRFGHATRLPRQQGPGQAAAQGQPEYGPHMDYSWMPKDINFSDLLEQAQDRPETPSRFKKQDGSFKTSTKIEDEPQKRDPRYMIRKDSDEDSENPDVRAAKQESIMEWFDRNVETELKKRREVPSGDTKPLTAAQAKIAAKQTLHVSRGLLERVTEASASQIEITDMMRMDPDTELTEAVEMLAKAETMTSFAGAVKAAEAAAETAPPELAEQAAAAGARGFQTEVQSIGKQSFSGIRPIEVVGYVGVTKPKYPKKSS